MSNAEHSFKGAVETEPTTSEKIAEQARETGGRMKDSALRSAQNATEHYVREPAKDILTLMKDYARDKPDVAACWCFALGMVVGWKLKP